MASRERRVYTLSVYDGYACGHSGACCTAGWPIPVERATFERLSEGIARGLDAFSAVPGAPPDTPVVTATRPAGACAFYEPGSGLCAIHRQAGESLLPVACRQFPRVSLLDGRGLFVTLSHYCPTAAAMLFCDDRPLEIVQSPAAFSADFPYEPLDARDALPPLLRPGVLLDLDSFSDWERAVVSTFGREELRPEAALASVTAMTEALRAWTPAVGELPRYLRQVLAEGRAGSAPTHEASRANDFHFVALVLAAIPQSLRPIIPLDRIGSAYTRWVEGDWPAFARPVRRYLASKAFGSWLAYQGHGLRTIVFSAAVALSTLKANAALECERAGSALSRDVLAAAIRRTDELWLHLASREELARAFNAIEKVDTPLSPDVR